MGVIKFLLILITCLVVGSIVAIFMVKNDMEIPIQILISATPLYITVGKLSAYSFLGGIALGIFMCVAYILVQFIELQSLKRKIYSQEKQIKTLRETSFKDVP